MTAARSWNSKVFLISWILINTITVHITRGDQDSNINQIVGRHLTSVSQPDQEYLHVELLSSKQRATVIIDGSSVFHITGGDEARGMYVVVVNQATGIVMAKRRFDTYTPGGSEELDVFLKSITVGRYMFFVLKDEATLSLTDTVRSTLHSLGSQLAESLRWRDMWVFATKKQGAVLGEDHSKSPGLSEWGEDTSLTITIPLDVIQPVCDWPNTNENKVRQKFCSQYEGYKELCDCSDPIPITIKSDPLPNNNIHDVPVGIIASNRPQYLFKSLRILLSTAGVTDILFVHGRLWNDYFIAANSSLVTVFIDGFYEEPVAVATLYNVRAVQHEPSSQRNGRITQHYGASLTKIFDLYPDAEYAIILEEDLEVSPDFFSYFSQTIGLMGKDDSIYCISAWNDLGYEHSCEDSRLLYRVETMPGLGWLLKRKMFKEELEPLWPTPDKLWDWDMWMRMDGVRKERECIIPDVSRTYHFGNSGTNVNPYFQEVYFKRHKLNTQPMVELKDIDRMTQDKYEDLLHQLIQGTSKYLKGDPCSGHFVPETMGETYTAYISKNGALDYATWLRVAKCLRLWDLDARGFHKSLWRFWFNSNHIIVIGCPDSPYCIHKPENVSLVF